MAKAGKGCPPRDGGGWGSSSDGTVIPSEVSWVRLGGGLGGSPVLDWLTLRADWSAWSEPLRGQVAALREKQGRMVCIGSGVEVEWQAYRRETIRSDSHRVTCFIGTDFELTGSPARSMGLPHNVWGSDDLGACVEAHIVAAAKGLGLELPRWGWRVTRLDKTFEL